MNTEKNDPNTTDFKDGEIGWNVINSYDEPLTTPQLFDIVADIMYN